MLRQTQLPPPSSVFFVRPIKKTTPKRLDFVLTINESSCSKLKRDCGYVSKEKKSKKPKLFSDGQLTSSAQLVKSWLNSQSRGPLLGKTNTSRGKLNSSRFQPMSNPVEVDVSLEKRNENLSKIKQKSSIVRLSRSNGSSLSTRLQSSVSNTLNQTPRQRGFIRSRQQVIKDGLPLTVFTFNDKVANAPLFVSMSVENLPDTDGAPEDKHPLGKTAVSWRAL